MPPQRPERPAQHSPPGKLRREYTTHTTEPDGQPEAEFAGAAPYRALCGITAISLRVWRYPCGYYGDIPAAGKEGGDGMISLLDRGVTLLVGALIVSLLAIGSSGAEPTYSFAATPGKLPKTVVPIHYSLDLQPDLEKLTLAGAEVVDIKVVHEPTDRLVLNAVNLTVEMAAIEGDAGRASEICRTLRPRP